MAEIPLRMIKLGGSLLDLPKLAETLGKWLSLQPPADNLLIVGGGPLVEAIRKLDRLHGLGEEASHWLSIRAMSTTAHLAAALLPQAEVIGRLTNHDAARRDRLRILDPWSVLREAESALNQSPLPHSWSVTSDSIAAWVAASLSAEELVLLKSTALTAGCDRRTASEQGLLDDHFAVAAAALPNIRWVNLRNASFAESAI